jgi:hypothetical protein
VKPRWWWLAPLLLLATAQAQTARGGVRILIYGAETVEQCAAPVKALQAELPTLDFPEGWTVAIVCNRIAWEQVLRIADPPPTSTAFSNLVRHSTVLNSAIFRQSRYQYRHTLEHELGHAKCMCGSEQQAEQFARRPKAGDRTMAKIDLAH